MSTAVFAGAYLAAWGGFSVIATALQWGLERAELLSPMMASSDVEFGGAIPPGHWLASLSGFGLITWGVAFLAAARA